MLWPRDCVERMIGDYDICGVMSLLGMVVWGARAVYLVRLDESQVSVPAGKC